MSFISVEPQSRVVLENHSDSLLAQFDVHLGIIADRYLAFFQERRRIEATYIDSLQKLHRKATTVDASYDRRAEPTTTRAAWDILIGNLDNEANTRQTFVERLDKDVIKPLETLIKSKAEMRKRIKRDLKASAAEYADHAEKTISPLQQAYLKKYHPEQYSRSTDVSHRPVGIWNKRIGGKTSTLFRGRRESFREPEPAQWRWQSEEDFEDDCRNAVAELNDFRSMRVEILEDGYDCLVQLVFTPTVKDVLVKYMDSVSSACEKYDILAKLTGKEVEKSLARTDASNI